MQRKLAAIIHADVVGYSRLMEGNETVTLRRLKQLRRELWDPKIAEFNGRLVGTAGDALLLEFQSAVSAVNCAVSMQQGMAERNAHEPDNRKMLLRIGVNLGEVIIDDDNDLFGDGVNVAARLQALADPGGIIVSSKVHDEVEGRVACKFIDGGEQQVKNIARPVRIYRVAMDSLPPPAQAEPPAMGAANAPTRPASPDMMAQASAQPASLQPASPAPAPPQPVAPSPAPQALPPTTEEARRTEPGAGSAGPPRTVTRIRTTIRRRVDKGWTFSGSDREGVAFEVVVREPDLLNAPNGLVLGRNSEQCQIVVAHGSLSRRHAILRLQDGRLTIEDVGSTNGTIVDGMRLTAGQPRPLRNGAQIVMGEIRFTLTEGDDAMTLR